MPRNVFRAHETSMRFICATSSWAIVQQAAAQLRNRLFRKSPLPQTGSDLVVSAIELTNVQNMHIAYQATIEDSSIVELLQFLQ